MTTIPDEPPQGYRTVHAHQHRNHWRKRLVTYLRTSPRYKSLKDATPEDAARRLGLTLNGTPCPWAVRMIQDDRDGRFNPDRTPPFWGTSVSRMMEIRASAAGMRVDTWARGSCVHIPAGTHRPDDPEMLGNDDWAALEALAVETARQAVADMRESFEHRRTPPGQDAQRVKGGSFAGRDVSLQRLALRLAGQAGTRNAAKTDRDWCDRVGIDRPGHGGDL